MTTLDRLHKKGLLARRKSGRAFVYTPHLGREEFERTMASELIGGLLKGDDGVRPILSSIVEAVGERDRAALDELERLVREKRKALNLRERRP
jgi:predicted transcriptional regulator